MAQSFKSERPVLLSPSPASGLEPGATVSQRIAAVRRYWARIRRRAFVALWHHLKAQVAVSAVIAAAITLPLVPVADVHATPIPEINEDASETIGWPTFTATVARVWNQLPPSERSRAIVYASNYGEAGAIARFGPKLGIPRPYSGHNAFWRFGRPPDGARPIIVVGYHDPASLHGSFNGCALSGRIDNGVALDNEEQGAPIWTCSTTTEPWSRLWPLLRSLNP